MRSDHYVNQPPQFMSYISYLFLFICDCMPIQQLLLLRRYR